MNTWLDLLDSLSTDGSHVLFRELHKALDTRLHASALTSKLTEFSSVRFFTSKFANTWLDLLDSLSTDGRHVLFCELHRALDTHLHASALTSTQEKYKKIPKGLYTKKMFVTIK